MKLILIFILIITMLCGCIQNSGTPNATFPGTSATDETTLSVTTTTPPPSTLETTTSPTTTVPPTTVPPTTAPPTTIPPTTIPTTTVPPTTVPPMTIPPTTAPPITIPSTSPSYNGNEMIGCLYTRAQLDAIDGTMYGCSHYGSTDAMKRPNVSVAYTNKFGKYNVQYIAPNNGKLYLTFTCGYEHTIQENGQTVRLTDRILDILKEKNVKATFIVNLYYAKTWPDIIQRIIDEGHILGNHSANHYSLPELSIDRVVDEIMTLHNFVLDKFGYNMTIFRPPSGYSSERVFAIAQSLGYKSVNYSFAYVDWETENQPNPDYALQNMLDRAHSGGIYQLHTVSATNAQVLGAAIDGIRAQGLEFSLLE